MFDANRAKILLKAMIDMLEQQERSHYVLNILEQTSVWDGAWCDGYCWLEEAKDLLETEKMDQNK